MKIKMKSLDAGPAGIRLAGKEYEVEDQEANALVEAGYAEEVKQPEPQIEEPSDDFDEITDVETFAELKADEQKALLAELEIEGDDSNEEKRIALFEGHLQEVGEPDGAETDNGTSSGADSEE